MLPSWFFFAVLAGLASNLFNFSVRHLLKDKDEAISFGWFSEVIRFCIALLILPFDAHFQLSSGAIIAFLILGLVEVISIYFFTKMHTFSQLSISTIISRTRLVWVPILAFLFLGEILNTTDYLGIIIVFIGLSVAVSPRKIVSDKSIKFAHFSALAAAGTAISLKYASPFMSGSFQLIGLSFLSIIFYPFFIKQGIKDIFKRRLLIKLLACVFNAIAIYLYAYALKIGEVGKVTAIYQGMMIVSVVLGIVVLKEREDVTKKILGTIIVLFAILLLIF